VGDQTELRFRKALFSMNNNEIMSSPECKTSLVDHLSGNVAGVFSSISEKKRTLFERNLKPSVLLVHGFSHGEHYLTDSYQSSLFPESCIQPRP
jgi:hypothetical protein